MQQFLRPKKRKHKKQHVPESDLPKNLAEIGKKLGVTAIPKGLDSDTTKTIEKILSLSQVPAKDIAEMSDKLMTAAMKNASQIPEVKQILDNVTKIGDHPSQTPVETLEVKSQETNINSLEDIPVPDNEDWSSLPEEKQVVIKEEKPKQSAQSAHMESAVEQVGFFEKLQEKIREYHYLIFLVWIFGYCVGRLDVWFGLR